MSKANLLWIIYAPVALACILLWVACGASAIIAKLFVDIPGWLVMTGTLHQVAVMLGFWYVRDISLAYEVSYVKNVLLLSIALMATLMCFNFIAEAFYIEFNAPMVLGLFLWNNVAFLILLVINRAKTAFFNYLHDMVYGIDSPA